MTDAVMTTPPIRARSAPGGAPPNAAPPVKPPWLRPATTAGVIAAHVALAALLMGIPTPPPPSLDSVNMDLVPEGDYIEQEEIAATPEEQIEDPNLEMPAPMVMDPEAVPLPDKKVVEKKKQVQEAQQRRRAGAPGGHAEGSGHSQSVCLAQIAAAIRRHSNAGSLGPGTAFVTFHVHAGGGVSVASAKGSTPAHAAQARRIVTSARGPSTCGAAFLSQAFNFH